MRKKEGLDRLWLQVTLEDHTIDVVAANLRKRDKNSILTFTRTEMDNTPRKNIDPGSPRGIKSHGSRKKQEAACTQKGPISPHRIASALMNTSIFSHFSSCSFQHSLLEHMSAV